MSPLKTSLLAALVSAALTAGCFYLVQSRRHREAASLRYANHHLRFTANQRQHSRPSAAASPSAEKSLEPKSRALSAGNGATAPAEIYRNEGRATPVATLQTYAWACDRGEAQAVAAMLYLDPPTRVKADAFLAALPPPARAQWKSVDAMAATALTADVMEHPFPGADLLATATIEPLTADRVLVRLPGTPKDRIEFQKTADGWSYVLTEAVVDAYIARAAARASGR